MQLFCIFLDGLSSFDCNCDSSFRTLRTLRSSFTRGSCGRSSTRPVQRWSLLKRGGEWGMFLMNHKKIKRNVWVHVCSIFSILQKSKYSSVKILQKSYIQNVIWENVQFLMVFSVPCITAFLFGYWNTWTSQCLLSGISTGINSLFRRGVKEDILNICLNLYSKCIFCCCYINVLHYCIAGFVVEFMKHKDYLKKFFTWFESPRQQ